MSRSRRRRRRRPARARVEWMSLFATRRVAPVSIRGMMLIRFSRSPRDASPPGYASFITGSTRGFICAMYMMPHIIQQQNTELANSTCGNLRGTRRRSDSVYPKPFTRNETKRDARSRGGRARRAESRDAIDVETVSRARVCCFARSGTHCLSCGLKNQFTNT